MNKIQKLGFATLFATVFAFGHGSVTPQKVDTTGLKQFGDQWFDENPYKQENARAQEVGKIGYSENCARCHGLDVISGGIAPDLRELPTDEDAYFISKVLSGVTRNGNVYMPSFAEVLSQEAIWAIRTYIVSQRIEAGLE
ncbi:MAG: cytochrome c-550 PedF [Halarcobacter sp.]